MTAYTRSPEKKLNSYERAKPAISSLTPRTAIAGGEGVFQLYHQLSSQLPARTSRFHQCIESDCTSIARLLARLGYQRPDGAGSGLYLRPGGTWPDIFADEKLAWSLQPFPGALWQFFVPTEEGGGVTLHVGDLISVHAGHCFDGDEQAMLAAHLKD